MTAHTDPADQHAGILLSTVTPERVAWRWPLWLPVGKLVVLDGRAGLGKSTLTAALAAAITTGWPLPGDEARYAPRGAVFVNLEDVLADSLVPRLKAHGADLERCVAIQTVPVAGSDDLGRLPTLPDDLPYIEAAIRRVNAGLLVVDPITATLGGQTDSHKDQHVRRVLAPLAALAEYYLCSVVVVRHLPKTLTGDATTAGSGSVAFGAAARVGWTMAADPDDPDRRIIAVSKSNVGKKPRSLTFTLVETEDYGASVLVWGDHSELTADDLVRPADGGDRDDGPSRTESMAWLESLLAGGAIPVRKIRTEAQRDGMPWRTVERAKTRLSVHADREGFGPGSQSVWRLPPSHTPPSTPDPESMAVYDGVCHRPPYTATPPYVVEDVAVYAEGAEGDDRATPIRSACVTCGGVLELEQRARCAACVAAAYREAGR